MEFTENKLALKPALGINRSVHKCTVDMSTDSAASAFTKRIIQNHTLFDRQLCSCRHSL